MAWHGMDHGSWLALPSEKKKIASDSRENRD